MLAAHTHSCPSSHYVAAPLPLARALQISHRTRWLVTHDWLRNAVFGRNISNI